MDFTVVALIIFSVCMFIYSALMFRMLRKKRQQSKDDSDD